jgi:hypothetical protein
VEGTRHVLDLAGAGTGRPVVFHRTAPWDSILLCLSPSASPLGAGRAVAGPPRGVCSDARCGMCLAPRLVR